MPEEITIPLSLLSCISEFETLGELQYRADEEWRKANCKPSTQKDAGRIDRANKRRKELQERRKLLREKLEKELILFRQQYCPGYQSSKE